MEQMIFVLTPDEYKMIRPLFASLNYHLATESIIQGLTQTMIIVDDKKSPTAAFTWYKNRAWLTGDPNNSSFNETLPKLLEKTFFHGLRRNEMNRFLLFYKPDTWKTCLDTLFKQMSRVEGLRHYYQLDASTRSWNISVPDGLILHPIDTTLLSKKYLKNLEES